MNIQSSLRRQMLALGASTFALLLGVTDISAAPIAANRLPASGWTGNVGVPGGIPTNYTQAYDVTQPMAGYGGALADPTGVADSSPAIQYAVTNCPNNKYVYIPAGNYRLNGAISRTGVNNFDGVQHPYSILIKGAGPANTKLFFYGPGTALSLTPAIFNARTMAITSGSNRGSTILNLTTVDPYLANNNYIVVNRLNAQAITDRPLAASEAPGAYMSNTTSQIVKVTNIAGNIITISPALNEGYPSDYISVGISAPFRSGIQDLYIENKTSNGGHNIHILFGQECWIKNVESNMASKWHVRLEASARCELRDSYVHDGWTGGGDSIYGFGLFAYSSNNLIENNIAERCRHSFVTEYGGQGNVFGYNYSKDPINGDAGGNPTGIQGGSPGQLATDYMMEDLFHHGGSPRYNLWEGNVGAKISADKLLGGSDYNTWFRNLVRRKGLTSTVVSLFGTDIQRGNFKVNLVGNVYEVPQAPTALRRWGSTGDDQSSPDPLSLSTAFLDGEHDAVTGTTTWDASNIAQTLPEQSYYLPGKPIWFGSTQNFPAFGPDALTATRTSLPAGYRYHNASPIETAPRISENPATVSVSAGGTVSLTVRAEGFPAPTIRWQESSDGTIWTDIVIATPYSEASTVSSYKLTSTFTASKLTITAAPFSLHNRKYRGIASNTISAVVNSDTTTAATLSVTKIAQSITFNAPPAKVFGDIAFTPAATASSGLAVTFSSSNPAVATTSGSTVTIVGAGSTTITAIQPGDGTYLAAADVAQTLTVSKAPLVVTANPATRAYGAANPTFAATISGFVNGQTLVTSGVAGGPSFSTNATASSAVGGSYAITPVVGTLSSANYSFSFTPGVLSVTAAPLTVTANAATRAYGAPDPPFSATITGFSNGENLASSGVTGTPSFTTNATAASTVGGSYTITPSVGTLSATNYSFTFAPGTLSVTKAPLTVSANSASRAYGAADPSFSATITGFANGETLVTAGVAGSPSFSTNATPTSGVGGSYAITPALGSLSSTNYSFTFAPALYSITKAPLTVTANAATRAYGAADPAFTATITGFVNGETLATSGVTGTTSFGTNATSVSPAGGSYLVTPALGALAAANYDFGFAPGILTITKVPLTVTADAASRAFGAVDPVFSATISGFVNGESVATSGVTGAPALSTTATAASSVGTYPITPTVGTLTATNYSFGSFTSGTLTINQAAQVITFAALASRYTGEMPFALVATAASGLPVSFSSSNPAVATISGSTVTVVAAGTTGVTASQGGNANYLAAPDVMRTLTVLAPTPAVITTHPANQSATSGANVVLFVAASGVPAPAIKWQISTNAGVSWADIAAAAPYSGVATDTLTITGVTVGLNGTQYRAVATNANGSVNSNAATLSVSAPVTPIPPPASSSSAPFFLTQPVGQVVTAGNNVTLSALVTGSPTPSLQWRKNGVAIAGANGSSLILNAVTTADTGAYALFASNTAGSVLSNFATISVQSAPVFTSQPSSTTVSVGATVVLSASVTGDPVPTLQWQRSGSTVAGATAAALTLSNVSLGDAGTYVLVATNSLGTASSSGAVLTVSGAPVITAQPVGQNVLAGTSLTFSVSATGSPAPAFQWRRNGAAIAGATGSTLALPNIQAAGAGTYDVVVSNSAGSVTSAPAILVVDTPSYAGTYFGSFPDGGSWALYVRADNTGTYLAFLPGSSTAIVTNLIINPDGTFTVTGSTIAATQAVSPVSSSSSPSTAAAPLPFTFTGRIVNGQLTASVLGRSVTGSADTGTTPSAGFYSASALLTASGTTFSVVGPSGKALVVTTSPTSVDGGVGTLSGTGAVTVATSSGAQLAMTVNADAKSIAATYTPVGSTAAVSFAGISDAVRVTSALANLSIRSAAGTLDQTLIVGFVVTGTSKPVLIRGIGPALAGFGVTGSLPDPKLDLARAGVAVASNDNWAAAVGDFFARVGAFGLTAGSRDAALLSTLEAANYTAQLSDVGGATGIAMVELYDTAADNGGRLINVSARSQVGTGGRILIAGFNVSGSGPRRMLIRAIGPGLTAFGVGGALADPRLDLYETGRAAVIASNDNWEASAAVTFGAVGAFGLTAGSRDAVLVVTLTPASYTAQVSGVGSTTGVALVEVYEVP